MTIETENQKSVKGRIVAAAWQLFYEKGYNGTTVDDIIDLSGTSKGSFYYYFNTKDELLNTLSMILDDNYEILKEKMDPDMNSYDKLLYLNYEAHSMIEEKINIDLLASLYSTQLVAQGHRSLLLFPVLPSLRFRHIHFSPIRSDSLILPNIWQYNENLLPALFREISCVFLHQPSHLLLNY